MSDSGWSGVMTAERALSVVPVYASVKKIGDAISTLPIHAYAERSDGSRRRTALPPSLMSPIGAQTRVEWVQQAVASLLLRGNAYGVVAGVQPTGWPAAVRWVHPDRVRVDESATGAPAYWLDDRRLSADEMIHVPAFVVPGKARGLSPVENFALTFDAGREAQIASREWSRNRAVPGIRLKNTARTMTPTEADAMASRARQKIRNGEPFVSGSDWSLDVLSIPSGDAAFLESIKANATQVASIYDIPAEMIGGASGGSLTYNTVEGQATHFLTYTIRPWIVKLETALSERLLPRGQYLRFSMDAFIRVDTATRYGTYRTAREIGLLSIDEIRGLEDRQPLPNGEGATFAPLPLMPKVGGAQ